ncbi:hypothetical protein CVT24_000884 [Panaeolus cyanescens]|uniref:Pentatricopeptide repeat-containing protein-mitochondrial domain-containing protein n=1 Tax=Panaeolus cyanescens TaxID=181874 RepID=A0A409YCB7_9AGAR|nr:hypothetical protein CVT24_000884 [Panaeolus cyanescens]
MLQRCIRTKRLYLEQQLVTWTSFRRRFNYEPIPFVANRNTLSLRLYKTNAAAQRKAIAPTIESPTSIPNAQDNFQRLCCSWSAQASKPKILVEIHNSPPLSALFRNDAQLKAALDSLIQSNAPHLLSCGLEIAFQAGSTLKPALYESLCFQLAQYRRWDIILGIVDSASRALVHLSTRLLNWRARSLVELQDYRPAFGVLQEFEQAGQKPNQRTYYTLISGCLRNADIHGAKQLIQDMHQSNIPISPELHSLIVQHYRDFGLNAEMLKATLNMLPSLKQSDALEVLNSLLQMTLDSAEYAITLQLLSYFNATPVEHFRSLVLPLVPDTILHNSSIDHSLRLEPNSTTTSLFMNFLVAKSVFQDAVQLGEDTLMKDQAPTEAFVASLINAYFMAGQDDDATVLLSRICSKVHSTSFQQLKVDVGHHGHTLGNIENMVPSTKLFNAFLKGICKRGADQVSLVFQLMESHNVQPNSRTVEILLSFIKSKVVHPRVLVQALKALTSPSVPVNIRHLHHIISAIASYDKHARFGRGWNRFSSKFTSNSSGTTNRISLTQPPSSSPTAGITVQDQSSYRKLLRPFLQSLNERGMKSDAAMLFLRLRIDALDSDMDSAQSIFRVLLARGIRPNRYHYSALIEGYARNGNFKSALSVLHSAVKSGVTPTVEMYTTIIASYARHHDPVSASKTFQRMLTADIRPDVAAIDALVSSYYAVGAYKIGRLMLIALWKFIAPFPEDMKNADLATLIDQFRALDQKNNINPMLGKRERVKIYGQIASLIDSYRRHFRP